MTGTSSSTSSYISSSSSSSTYISTNPSSPSRFSLFKRPSGSQPSSSSSPLTSSNGTFALPPHSSSTTNNNNNHHPNPTIGQTGTSKSLHALFQAKKTASLVSPLGITQTGSTFAPIMSSTSSPSSNVKHLPNLNVSNSNNISNIEAIADHPETLESALTYIEELTHRLITLEDKHEKLQLFVQNIYERLNQ